MWLMAGIFALTMASCSDDNDLPEVNISVDLENVTVSDGVIYIVQGTDISVKSIEVESLNGKNSALANVAYYWDNSLVAMTNIDPFSCKFQTSALGVGNHLFQIRMNVLQEDKSLATSWISYNVVVVASAEDLPAGTEPPGSATLKGTGKSLTN